MRIKLWKFTIEIYFFCRAVVLQFTKEGCMYRAAALAYTSLLSLVPLMTVSFVILKAFPVFHNVSQQVQNFIFNHFVAASADVIQQYLGKFSQQASHLSATGMLTLVITAVLMIFNMEEAFNDIWYVKERRRGVPAFLMYWAVLTLLPMLLGVGIALSSYVASLPLLSDARNLGIIQILFACAPLFLSFIAFTLLYVAIPNCKVPTRAAVIGGVVAAALFEIAKYCFALYIAYFPTYELLYGALAAIPIFLIWVYLSWLVILFGAVVSHVLASRSLRKRNLSQAEAAG